MIGILSARLEAIREGFEAKCAEWGWDWINAVDHPSMPKVVVQFYLHPGAFFLSLAYHVPVTVTRVRESSRPDAFYVKAWCLSSRRSKEEWERLQERMRRDRKRLSDEEGV